MAGAERELLVIDASAVVALIAVNAGETRWLSERIGDAMLFAPSLLLTEVDGALRGLELGRKLSTPQVVASRWHARRLPIEFWPGEAIAERAWELRTDLTIYDASYVALSERLGAVLLTGDRRIANAGVARCPVEVVDLGR
ncbi:type II toxin-antitoxin system VapC family toxin [Microbacterium azadirachtae]|uniref:Ribonuclease VapC3 n=1 Tax=Microbacterium azadirachtae TaxID=582680 RepID=A0A0F0LE07_9MICO|nr:type II toxin-antitoxin system VapC family toxin [Microbacterium azadirachtae]KJL31452.1 Ribonuclease VapC3 [Microbacterium azadirachtae]